MSRLQEILAYNKKFVSEKAYESFVTSRYPDKKLAILSCMDTRLTALLSAAMNIKNGDVKIIQNAGAVVSHPFGSVMRSLLLAVFEFGVEEILVVGHYACGMQSLDADALMRKMMDRGISRSHFEMIHYCGTDLKAWLSGFDDVRVSVSSTVNTIRRHPLMPEDVMIYGLIIDPQTGRLDPIE